MRINPRIAVLDKQVIQALAIHFHQADNSAVLVNILWFDLDIPPGYQSSSEGLCLLAVILSFFRAINPIQSDFLMTPFMENNDGIPIGHGNDLGRPGKRKRRRKKDRGDQ